MNKLKVIVKHECGHYEIHETDARNENEAAKAEAELSRCECSNCQGES